MPAGVRSRRAWARLERAAGVLWKGRGAHGSDPGPTAAPPVLEERKPVCGLTALLLPALGLVKNSVSARHVGPAHPRTVFLLRKHLRICQSFSQTFRIPFLRTELEPRCETL